MFAESQQHPHKGSTKGWPWEEAVVQAMVQVRTVKHYAVLVVVAHHVVGDEP